MMKTIRIVSKTLRTAFCEDTPLLLGSGSKNWGDRLNPVLFELLSGRKPIMIKNDIINVHNKIVYSAIGSVLDVPTSNNIYPNNLVIWGTGFISDDSKLLFKPKQVAAVRGPLTRDLMIKQGYFCPEIFGDPALLLPLFYKPEIKKQYRLGVIPHYIDRKLPIMTTFKNMEGVKIIDILGGINPVVDEILSCEKIASSSLHGIIAADAYGVPSTWLKLSNNVFGNGFKFQDYFLSVGRMNEVPTTVQPGIDIEEILDKYDKYRIDINLTELIDSCPFIK